MICIFHIYTAALLTASQPSTAAAVSKLCMHQEPHTYFTLQLIRKQRCIPPTPKQPQHLLSHPNFPIRRQPRLQIRCPPRLHQEPFPICTHPQSKEVHNRISYLTRIIDRHAEPTESPRPVRQRLARRPSRQNRRQRDTWRHQRNRDGELGQILLEGAEETYDAFATGSVSTKPYIYQTRISVLRENK